MEVLTMSSLIILFVLLSLFGALTTKEPPTIEEIIRCVDDCQEAYKRCRVCLGLKFTKEDGYCFTIRFLCIKDCVTGPEY
ncbi:hypothetical protein LSAT2_010798 [Lamellibrachia satsuma]|nr:hypothetical protein LSAT2_010798 [Lamellibrachia satsuma]